MLMSRSRLSWFVALAALIGSAALGGCRSTLRCADDERLDESGGCAPVSSCPRRDPATGECLVGVDGGGEDSGPGIDGCVASLELCDGNDDDCDGAVDEEAACDAPNGTARCEMAMCTVTGCETGFFDCTGDPGCETSSSRSNCGGCAMSCAALEGCGTAGCALPSFDWALRGLRLSQVVAGGSGRLHALAETGSIVDGSPLVAPAVLSISGTGSVSSTQSITGQLDGLDISGVWAGPTVAHVTGSVLNGMVGVGITTVEGADTDALDAFVVNDRPALVGTLVTYNGSGDQQVAAAASSENVFAAFGLFTSSLNVSNVTPAIAASDNFELFLHVRQAGGDDVFTYPSSAMPSLSRLGTCILGPPAFDCIRAGLQISSDEQFVLVAFGSEDDVSFGSSTVLAPPTAMAPSVVALRVSDGTVAWQRTLPGGSFEEAIVPIAVATGRVIVATGTRAYVLDERTGADVAVIDLPTEHVAAQGESFVLTGPLTSPVSVDGDSVTPMGAFNELITVYDAANRFVAGLQLVSDSRSSSQVALDPLGGLVLNPFFTGVLTIDGMSFDAGTNGRVLARYQLP